MRVKEKELLSIGQTLHTLYLLNEKLKHDIKGGSIYRIPKEGWKFYAIGNNGIKGGAVSITCNMGLSKLNAWFVDYDNQLSEALEYLNKAKTK